MPKFRPRGIGWQRDFPILGTSLRACRRGALLDTLEEPDQHPKRVDWREYCLAIENGADIHTSAAGACVALLSFFERRGHRKTIAPSSLFLHQTAQRLAGHSCQAIARYEPR